MSNDNQTKLSQNREIPNPTGKMIRRQGTRSLPAGGLGTRYAFAHDRDTYSSGHGQ